MTVTPVGLAQSSIMPLTADRNVLGESPVWDAAAGALYWADIVNGRVHRLSVASGERAVWEFGEPVASFGLCRSGRLVIALRAEVILFDPEENLRTPLASVTHGKPDMRFNDGKVGPDGAFWVGSGDASGDANPVGTLYRVTAFGEITVVTSGLRVSNGLAWDASGTRMFHSDSRGPWIDVLDFDPGTGEASNRRRFRDLDEAIGRPDGGACDMEGCYWSAGISAGRLNRFAPDGTLLEWVEVPSLRPTMPCFGGPEMKTLYLTSLSSGVSDELLKRYPLCGTLVQLEVGVAGAPVSRFAD